MSWFPERSGPSWLQRFCSRILKSGPIPKHVAFIMDGNRRFASKNSMDRAQGHVKGFDKLTETLEWCLNLGITEVTVYAISIDNFKRSKEEVACLMELAQQKFARLLEEKEQIGKHGVCIRVLGNLSLLPMDLQEIIGEVVDFTKNNTRAILNVCFAYNSRDEICAAIQDMAEGVELGLIKPSDVSEELLEKCLYTSKSADPDLLIRTSGEVRLSGFLLWQCAFSCLSFMKVLWPEFSIWHLYAGILHYQWNYQAIETARECNRLECEHLQQEEDYKLALEEVGFSTEGMDMKTTQTYGYLYSAERQHRTKTFLSYVNSKRDRFFNELSSRRKINCKS